MDNNKFQERVLRNQEDIIDFLTSPQDVVFEEKEKERTIKLEEDLLIAESRCVELKKENMELENELKEERVRNDSLLEKLKQFYSTEEKREEKIVKTDNEWKIPGKLLENNEFSLKVYLEGRARTQTIIDNFKKFIFILVYDLFDDDTELFEEYLDLKDQDLDKKLREKAHSNWSEGLGMETSMLALSEELEKIPQKNRYKILIEKFEKMLH